MWKKTNSDNDNYIHEMKLMRTKQTNKKKCLYVPVLHKKRRSLGKATSDWTDIESSVRRRRRPRWFPARRVQAMTLKSSLTVIVQPIAFSLTPVGGGERAQNAPASRLTKPEECERPSCHQRQECLLLVSERF